MSDPVDRDKQQAAEYALDYVRDGVAIGLGTGVTAGYLLHGLAARLRDGRLRGIVGVPTSEQTAALARQLGIPLVTLEQHPELEIAFDGADEVDPRLDVLKGLGGALLREKIVAASARRLVIMGARTKLVEQLGTLAPLPVEVIAFGLPLCARRLAELGGIPALRRTADGSPFRTDEGHVILDCRFDGIPDPPALSTAISAIPGVVEHGLFVGMADLVLLVGDGAITTMVRGEAVKR